MVDWNWEIEQSRKRQELSDEARKNGSTTYWYYIETDWCPVCLSERTSRTRYYYPKPSEYSERRVWLEVWDYCDI
jgi:hypothetical protein